MNHPPEAQSGDHITCALISAPGFHGAWATYLGFYWRTQKWLWCCPDSPAPICCPGSHQPGFLQGWLLFSFQVERKLCVLVSPLELRPPAEVVLEGRALCHGPFQLPGCSAVRSPEKSLWHSVLELDLLEHGNWWKPSLHNAFPTYRQWCLAQS